MRYALIHTVDPDLAPATLDEQDEAWETFTSWLEELIATGTSLHGSRLRPPEDATTVRIRDGRVLVTDGPFTETREHVGGYDVIECASRDEAVQLAARHPHARMGSTEVRAFPAHAAGGHLPDPAEGKTRYIMFVCTDPSLDPKVFDDMEPVDAWVAETDGAGVRVFGSELEPPETARTVRVRDGETLVTDGPFAETKEQVAGFDLLDCADLDEVLEVAARHPMARGGILEVRPLWPHRE